MDEFDIANKNLVVSDNSWTFQIHKRLNVVAEKFVVFYDFESPIKVL